MAPEAVSPYLPALCRSLRSSMADTSWPIRDTAATAVGRFLRYNGLKLAPSFFCSPSATSTSSSLAASITPARDVSAESGKGEVVIGDTDSSGNSDSRDGMQEVVGDLLGLLFACLREDPFRPVRESAAVGLVDICLHEDVGESNLGYTQGSPASRSALCPPSRDCCVCCVALCCMYDVWDLCCCCCSFYR